MRNVRKTSPEIQLNSTRPNRTIFRRSWILCCRQGRKFPIRVSFTSRRLWHINQIELDRQNRLKCSKRYAIKTRIRETTTHLHKILMDTRPSGATRLDYTESGNKGTIGRHINQTNPAERYRSNSSWSRFGIPRRNSCKTEATMRKVWRDYTVIQLVGRYAPVHIMVNASGMPHCPRDIDDYTSIPFSIGLELFAPLWTQPIECIQFQSQLCR